MGFGEIDFMSPILDMMSNVMWIVSLVILVIALPFVVMILFFIAKKRIKGIRMPKQIGISMKHMGSKIKRLLVDFPRQLVEDLYNRNPDFLDKAGVYFFEGEQGAGKTLAVVEYVQRLKRRYPYLKVRSNIKLDFADGRLNTWEDLVFNNNGEYGQVEFIDEIQNWFSSNDSKNFPPEMLQEISQQRKQRKLILCTSQSFRQVAVALRRQCTLLFSPFTFAKCITFVRVRKPFLSDEGTVVKSKLVDFYFFVHSKELRESYDTYEKVEKLSLTGFKDRSQQLSSDTLPSISFDFGKKGKK